ncbi:MAG: amino acid adenylation domain-containing protein, partial [Agarilytica sp.]
MNIVEFISFLANKKIKLSLVDEKLKVSAPAGVITEEIKREMSLRKEEIRKFLTENPIIRAARRVPVKPVVDRSSFPLSFSQQRLWFLDKLEPESTQYNIPVAIRICGELDVNALETTFMRVVARHESLRSNFNEESGEPTQFVRNSSDFKLSAVDFSSYERDECEEKISQIRIEESSKRFDLSRDLMVRATLIKLSMLESVLLVTMHHIASDGWSAGVLVQELGQLYNAYKNGQTDPLPALEVQYGDYAHWQRGWLQGETLDKLARYWQKQLANLPEVHNLPLDHGRPSHQTFDGGQVSVLLDKARLNKLTAICNDYGVTLFVGLQSVFSVLLARYSGETDIVVGSPIANREQAEVAGLIGFFVNTLVLRSNVSSDLSFADLLQQNNEVVLDAFAHQQMPFERLVDILQPERASNYTPLFQVMLTLQNNEIAPLVMDGVSVELMPSEQAISKFDLTLSASEKEEGLDLNWVYNSNIFDGTTIEQMSRHFVLLLDNFIRDPLERVGYCDFLTDEEKQRLLVEWNDTERKYKKNVCIHELFEDQVLRAPNATALIFENTHLSYAELNIRANQLAHYLVTNKCVGPDALVGVCLERSLELVVAILAIVKAGGAYVPLDPDYPEVRLSYMLKNADLTTVVTKESLIVRTPITLEQAIILDSEVIKKELSLQSTSNLACKEIGLEASHLAYVLYTSGSTGKPKGVMVEHKAIVNRILWMHRQYQASSSDIVLQKTPCSFDVSVWEFFGPITIGAKMVIAKPKGHIDPYYLCGLIQHHEITTLHFVPPVLRTLLKSPDIEKCVSLRTVYSGGESLTPNLIKGFYQRLPHAGLHHLYGPTEAAVDVSSWQCPNEDALLSEVPIGRPIDNIHFFVLDEKLNLLPRGVIGELYIGGVGLARGYLNRPDLTAEKFIQNPFSHDPLAHLYKTGDLVRWLPDGNLEFKGRVDHQVKVRGFRIELGEIETSLSSYHGIRESVVTAGDIGGDKRLIAYVVLNDEENTSYSDDQVAYMKLKSDAWQSHLRERLPEYMVPTAFVIMGSIPLTPNGKVDRKALPEPDMAQLRNEYVAPVTAAEKSLCSIWQDLLGVEKVGVTDNFFRLGGHSLLLIQMLARLQEAGWYTDVRSLFDAPNLGSLAPHLEALTVDRASLHKTPENLIPATCDQITSEMLTLITLEQPTIDHIVNKIPGGAGNVQDIYPLAPLQEGILFHHQLQERDGDTYVSPFLMSAENPQQRDNFLRALQFVMNRHDVLRTAILWKGLRQAVQVVCRHVDLPVEHLKLEREVNVMSQVNEWMSPSKQKMDVEEAPLLRVTVADDPLSERSFILLRLHHIVSDHVGLDIIQSEVQAFIKGNTGDLAPARAYREFVSHALHQMKTSNAEEFFLNRLGDVTEPTAPFNLLDVHGNAGEIVETNEHLSLELSQKVRQVSKRLAISPAALFHAGFALVLSACTGRDDVVFGTVLSGRLQGTSGAGNMMGMFINTLPYRLSLKDAKTEGIVLLAQSELSALLPYEQASLVLAQQCSALPNDVPLFSAILNYRHSSPETNEFTLNTGIEILSGHERTNYPFTVSIDDLDEGFAITAQVNDRLDPESVVAYIRTAMENLVEVLEHQPERLLLTLDVLPKTEREKLLTDWNATKADYPQDRCIHELFEAQVEKAPDAIALTFQRQQLSYGELNQQANQLAHYLVNEKNVSPDALVGVCLERSLDMVVAILGVLKAGGAYVPLDPDYPEARLEYTIQDASLDTVITNSDALSRTPIVSSQAVCLDAAGIQAKIGLQPADNLTQVTDKLSPHHLAYVIYTSGSTGTPKGVTVEHKNVTSLAINAGYVPLSSGTVMLHNSTVTFDAATFELWGTLLNGGRLVIQAEHLLAMEALGSFIQNNHINTAWMTSGLFDQFVSIYHDTLPELQYLLVGGDVVNTNSVEKILSTSANINVINGYGPTENTTFSTSYPIQLNDTQKASIPIGSPLNNRRAFVVDTASTELKLSPIGVVGELYLGGDGLSRGYLNRPELTIEKFVPNPFSKNAQDRLYKTGDLVRWLPDGNLEYIGRIDAQVKIRGFRIELGEIENTLLALESIQECVVTAREDKAGDKRLVAYVVFDEVEKVAKEKEGVLDSEYLLLWREYLSQNLPDYMVPSSFVVLDNIPLTSNGKVDRKALPAPDLSQQQEQYVAPSTNTEKLLCGIWQDILGLEKVGVTDNFFRLGGHSLLLIQMLAQLQEAGFSANVKQLFGTRSLGELADQIDDRHSSGDGSSSQVFSAPENLIPSDSENITPEMLSLISLTQGEINSIVNKIPGGAKNIQDIYPLAPLQEGILFHHQINEGGGDPYALPALLSAKTRQQRDKFLQALQVVVNRHDVLRTAVLWKGLSSAVQVVCREIKLPVEEIALDSNRDVMPQLHEKMAPEQQWMDLSEAPLLRVKIAENPQTSQFFILLQLHHIVSDHVGMEIIKNEVQEILSGHDSALDSPEFYREFVAHTLHQSRDLNAEEFFRNKLSCVTEPTAPFNLLNVHGSGGEIIEDKRQLPKALSESIRKVANQFAVSPAALFHAGFALVLSACSGREDIVFGTVLSGRLQGTYGAGSMMGMFINTLPYRLNLTGMSVEQALQKAQAELVELLPHEQASLALAQQCSGVAGDAPLFSAILNYRHSSPPKVDFAKNTGIDVLFGQERSNYPFTVSVDDLGDGFALKAQVNEVVDPRSVVGYFHTAMENLVHALSNDKFGKTSIFEIDVLPKEEHRRLLVEWNETEVDFPKGLCVHELFETQVKNDPSAIALVFEEKKLSYGELNEQANQLAHYLVNKKSIRPDILVGICLERSSEMIVAILAVLKAGGAYVPLDPAYPEARLKYLIDDAALNTIISSSENIKGAPISSEQALCIDDPSVQKEIFTQSKRDITTDELGHDSHHLAYVIYTSGSTGNPKGVMIPHFGLTNLIVDNVDRFELNEGSRFLQSTSINFDAASWVIWMSLVSRATLVIANEILAPREEIENLICRNRVTHLMMTPSSLSQFKKNSLPGVKCVIVGGENCSQELADKWSSSCLFFNAYGPTENTICSTVRFMGNGDVVSIGKPVSNNQVFVLKNGKPLPLGAVGELHLGGAGVARGYLNRPNLTAEKFIPNPFCSDTGERLYRTGDLVRWLPDGNLEYMGRIDDQVKIRGFRIELGEVENTLLTCENIQECVVIAHENQQGDKRLVAYIVLDDAESLDKDEVLDSEYQSSWRDYLGRSLPDYMVPSNFVVLPEIPLTPNGKVDREALPAPDLSQQQERYVAPSTETERCLSKIWQDILGLEQVGVTDNFFRLGGHSLLLIQVLSRLQEAGYPADVKKLFSANSLGDLAAQLDSESNLDKDISSAVFVALENLIPESCDRITPEMLSLVVLSQVEIDNIVKSIPGGAKNIQDIYPLAPLQEGILFHYQMSEGVGDPYVLPVLLSAKTKDQRDAFIQALQGVVNRHDVLRTAIFWGDLPCAVQVVCRHVDLAVESINLDVNSAIVPQLLDLVTPEKQSLDITKAPLLRARIADNPKSGQYFILLQYHHIINDHVALEIIKSEVQTIMEGHEGSLITPRPYREFVAHTLDQRDAADAESFFREKLGDIHEPTVPFNLLEVHGDGSEIAETYQKLPEGLSGRIRGMSSQLSISPAALFHAVYGLVVGACSKRDDVVFGTVLSGRLQGASGSEHMLGMFINTLPYRLSFQGLTAKSAVLQAQSELSELLAYEQASLALAQQYSGLPKGTPLFSAILNYRHGGPEENELAERSDIEVLHVQERTNYPFTVSVGDLGKDFAITAQVSEEVGPSRVVVLLQTAMESLLTALEHEPEKPVLDTHILAPDEYHKLLVEWNDTEEHYPKDLCIHELIEIKANDNPDAVALVFEESALCYQELNRKSNQLAHYLISEKGVVPGTLVGICLDRSLEMVVALLGILKAGGAYVPLDPEYPEARLAYMIQDASLKTVITDRDVLLRTPTSKEQALCLDDESVQRDILYQPQGNVLSEKTGLSSADLAYVIYTSGSTGKPKGVEITHRSVVNFLHVFKNRLCLNDSDRWLAVTPISFDIAVLEIYLPLITNCCLVIADSHSSKSGESLAGLIQKSSATVMQATPATWSMLDQINKLPSFKYALVGGDIFSLPLAKKIRERVGNLLNLYGPTEATVWATIMDLPRNLDRILIGKPMANTSIYIVNDRFKITPIGVPGELLIGGDGLARGYFNRLALTEERFIKNPFDQGTTSRLYRTGDLARWLPDGNIEFVGRIDDQVKIRGFRIELGEIENILLTHSSVKEAVVVARGDYENKQLVAYVVRSDSFDSKAPENAENIAPEGKYIETLNDHLGVHLPNYMVPSNFVVLEQFPLTPNGKIDRKSLPAPDLSQRQDCIVEPSTQTEKILCGIWQDILSLERIGVTDNFFRLGGHSLLATRLVAQMKSVTSVDVSLKEVFEFATIREIAKIVDASKKELTQTYIHAGSREEPLVLSYGQQRLWFLDQIALNSAQYNMPAALKLSGALHREELSQSLTRIIDRHESLRTVFFDSGEGPLQLIQDRPAFDLPVTDLSTLSDQVQSEQIDLRTAEEA